MVPRMCLIGLAEVVCDTLSAHLESIIGEYVTIDSWCLESTNAPPPHGYDLYLTTYPGTHVYAERVLPKGSRILLGDRFVSPSNLDRLLELPQGSKVLVVDNSLERSEYLLQGIRRFGAHHLDYTLYYPGCPKPVYTEYAVAVAAGRKKNVPEELECIDLGVKDLTLETYAEILKIFSIPTEVLNTIAYSYMDAVFQSAKRNHNSKMRLNNIINSVDEIILWVNEHGDLIIRNHAAERLLACLERPDCDTVASVFPELKFPLATATSECLAVVDGQRYMVQAKAVDDADGGKIGAVVIAKPVSQVRELESKVRRELKAAGLMAKYTFADILGKSPVIRQTVAVARKFAAKPLTVLLEGESGVGKELFAQAIHQASGCSDGPFVAFNFSALPESLAESELFGYAEGAFTGARRGGKPGLFEQAHNGTIFLDELGAASLGVQPRLLRVLEEREVRRIGGERVQPVSVRVIAASNEDLSAMVRDKQFREDLFYRICVCPLHIPSLRERTGDVLLLATHFARVRHAHVLKFSKDLEHFCNSYRWPGNVRELHNVVTYLCTIVPSGRTCSIADLPRYLQSAEHFETACPDDALHFTAISDALAQSGLLHPGKRILAAYNAQKTARAMGRESIVDALKKENAALSHYKLRRCLQALKEYNLLRSGTTRQGTAITPLGRDFLRHLDTVRAMARDDSSE